MKKSILATLAGIAAVSAASAAMAATPQITDISGGGTGAPHNPYQVKYIATEMYNNVTGVNSNNVEFFARLGGDVSKGDSVNIKGYSADVNLGSQNLFLLGMEDNIAVVKGGTDPSVPANIFPLTGAGATALGARATGAHTEPCATAVLGAGVAQVSNATNYLFVGESNATGVQNQITMLGVDLGTFCKLNTGDATVAVGYLSTDIVKVMSPPAGGNTWVSTALGSKDANGKVVPQVKFAVNLSIYAGLNPNNDCTSKDIKLHLVTNQETINPQTVLQIIPQFTGAASTTALQQELSTNDDFKKFIAADNSVYSVFNRTIGAGGTLFDLTDLHFSLASTKAGMFRSFVPQTASAALTYKLTSLSAQAGVSMSEYPNTGAPVACTKDATNKIFSCGTGNGFTTLDLTTVGVAAANGLAGTSNAISIANAAVSATSAEMIPTTWTASDFVFSINSVTDVCVAPAGGVGSWYGGIEAIVPFVKTAAGYETYIKLYNRYSKAAKLYIADMNTIQDSIVTSINQLPVPNDSIPTGSFVTISGTDLMNGGILTATETANGAPIKFLIRVPAQMGNPAFTTLADTLIPTLNGGSAAGVATASVVDPYINGIVIQVTPNGSQRSIPLTFKSFKQGQYN